MTNVRIIQDKKRPDYSVLTVFSCLENKWTSGNLIENFSTSTLDLSSAPAGTYNVQLHAKAYDGLPADLEVTDAQVLKL